MRWLHADEDDPQAPPRVMLVSPRGALNDAQAPPLPDCAHAIISQTQVGAASYLSV